MIDVQHSALRPFKHEGLAIHQSLIQQRRRVTHKGSNLRRSLSVLVVHLVGIQGFGIK